MRVEVNGEARDIAAGTLGAALEELGYAGMTVATALNGEFVPRAAHGATALAEGDRIEVVAPLKGG